MFYWVIAVISLFLFLFAASRITPEQWDHIEYEALLERFTIYVLGTLLIVAAAAAWIVAIPLLSIFFTLRYFGEKDSEEE